MPFPDTPRVEFRQNPLVEVICQLRFPTILAISDPARFQDHIRQEYPLYEIDEAQKIPEGLGAALRKLVPTSPQDKTHKFSDEEEKRTASVNPDFLALLFRDYRRWEAFSAELSQVREAFEEIYNPSFYSRVGLRYRNAIVPELLGLTDRPWRELVKPHLAGVLSDADVGSVVEETHTQSKIRLEDVPDGYVTLRHGLGLLSRDDKQWSAFIIDADFYTDARQERTDVDAILDGFHRLAGNLFRWAVQDELSTALDPSPITDA